jgi:hypothetical protein
MPLIVVEQSLGVDIVAQLGHGAFKFARGNMAGDLLAKFRGAIEYFLRRGHGRSSLITIDGNGW